MATSGRCEKDDAPSLQERSVLLGAGALSLRHHDEDSKPLDRATRVLEIVFNEAMKRSMHMPRNRGFAVPMQGS